MVASIIACGVVGIFASQPEACWFDSLLQLGFLY